MKQRTKCNHEKINILINTNRHQSKEFLSLSKPIFIFISQLLDLTTLDNIDNLLDDRGIRQSRNISKLILLTHDNLSQNTSHDLSRSCLGQIRHNKDLLGRSKGSDAVADLQSQLGVHFGLLGAESFLEADKGYHGLTGDFVGDTNDGGLGHSGVFDHCGFDFGGRETVTADVDYIVDTAADPVETILITGSSITSELKYR